MRILPVEAITSNQMAVIKCWESIREEELGSSYHLSKTRANRINQLSGILGSSHARGLTFVLPYVSSKEIVSYHKRQVFSPN